MQQLPSVFENNRRLNHILILVIVFLAVVIIGGTNFNGLYGQDSHEYLRFAKNIKNSISGNEVLTTLFWPKLYPIIGAIIGLTGLPMIAVMQGISIIAFIGTILILKKIIALVYEKDATIYLLIGAITQVYFLRGGFLVMSDMISCFFITCTLYFFHKSQHKRTVYNVGFIILFALFAFFTRYASAIILLPVITFSMVQFIRQLPNLTRWIVLISGSCIAIFIIYLNNHFLVESSFRISEWSVKNFFSKELIGRDGVSMHTVPNGLYIFGNFFHFGYLSIGVLLLPFYGKINVKRIETTSILIYLLFIGGLATQNYRFLLILHPFVLILLFPAFIALWQWLQQHKLSAVFIMGVLIFNCCFFMYSFSKTLQAHHIERMIVKEIKRLNSDAPIYSFYVDQSFASYGINNQVYNFYYQEYDTFEKNALVVFNEGAFKDQWKGHPVMNNWNRLHDNYSLDTLVKLQSNWRIYRVK